MTWILENLDILCWHSQEFERTNVDTSFCTCTMIVQFVRLSNWNQLPPKHKRAEDHPAPIGAVVSFLPTLPPLILFGLVNGMMGAHQAWSVRKTFKSPVVWLIIGLQQFQPTTLAISFQRYLPVESSWDTCLSRLSFLNWNPGIAFVGRLYTWYYYGNQLTWVWGKAPPTHTCFVHELA